MDDASVNKLVDDHLFLVKIIVGRESRKLSSDLSVKEEMRAFATEGLVVAARTFDPQKGIPFKAYAELKMKWAIYDGLCQVGWFPRRLKRKINFYKKAEDILRSHTNTPPPKDKVEAVHRLSDRLKELACAYITTYTAEDGNEPAAVPPMAEETLERKRFKRRIKTYIDTLPSKERHIIQRYFFEDVKLNTIADEMCITKSWASRLLHSGLNKLRDILDDQPELANALPRGAPRDRFG